MRSQALAEAVRVEGDANWVRVAAWLTGRNSQDCLVSRRHSVHLRASWRALALAFTLALALAFTLALALALTLALALALTLALALALTLAQALALTRAPTITRAAGETQAKRMD